MVDCLSVRFKNARVEKKAFKHSYTVECGNRLRVGVRAKNASVSGFACLSTRSGKPNQRKGQNEKFMNFAHFCEFWCFSLGKQARFTLNFCSGTPLRKVHELTFLWFGLQGWLLSVGPSRILMCECLRKPTADLPSLPSEWPTTSQADFRVYLHLQSWRPSKEVPKPWPGKVPKKCFGKCRFETGCRAKCRKKCSGPRLLYYLYIGAGPGALFSALSSVPRFGPALPEALFSALFLARASALL